MGIPVESRLRVAVTACAYPVVDEFARFVADHVAQVSVRVVLHAQEAFAGDVDVVVAADTSRLAAPGLLNGLPG